MKLQRRNRRRFSASRRAQEQGHEAERLGPEARPPADITQAERAAMHPERHDLEWGYYHTAWSF